MIRQIYNLQAYLMHSPSLMNDQHFHIFDLAMKSSLTYVPMFLYLSNDELPLNKDAFLRSLKSKDIQDN